MTFQRHTYTYRYAHIGIDTGGVCGMYDSHMADVVASVASVTIVPCRGASRFHLHIICSHAYILKSHATIYG